MENKTSSIVSKEVQPARDAGFVVESWHMVVFLVGFFLLLKFFIYIKDGKRHGK